MDPIVEVAGLDLRSIPWVFPAGFWFPELSRSESLARSQK